MEIAKISSKGQITIPVSVRKKLNLKTGDKIMIFEENGRFYFDNSAMLAFKRVEEAFAGEAVKAGFEKEEDMQDYMREIRKEVRGYQIAYNARHKCVHFYDFFPSSQTRELAKRLTDEHQIVVCDYVIEELRLVVARKFPMKKMWLDQFFRELPFELVYTPKEIELSEFPIIRDAKDYPILATAILENVDIFITGDKDFLVLEDVETPEIVTMVEFLNKYTL